MLVFVDELVESEFCAVVEKGLVDVGDYVFAADCLLEQVYLGDDFLGDVVVAVLECMLYGFEDCAEDYVCVGYQLGRDFLTALSK